MQTTGLHKAVLQGPVARTHKNIYFLSCKNAANSSPDSSNFISGLYYFVAPSSLDEGFIPWLNYHSWLQLGLRSPASWNDVL